MSRQVSKMRIAALLLALLGIASGAKGQGGPTNYAFVVGSGFLCDSNDSGTCPSVAKATQGDSYEMSGAGTFDAQAKSVKATGTYIHKSTTGHALETGIWIANELVSFVSYGAAPSLLKKGLGPQPWGPRPRSAPLGPMPTGGLAVLQIVLLPVSGNPITAILEVNCALGDVPHERSVEGIRLTLDRSGTSFSEEAGGRVMFLALRSAAPPQTGNQDHIAVPAVEVQPTQ